MPHTVLISGASRGIGRETAKALASDGSRFDTVVLVARPSEDLDTAIADVKALAGNKRVVSIPANLSDLDNVTEIYDTLADEGIAVNTIVNNAGVTMPASINEAELADFELTMRVNVFAPFRMIQEALRRNHPLEQIVNIASTAGITCRAGWLTYSTSKAAMINMSEVLREELEPYGVDVISLSPGRCATALRKKLAPDEDPSTIMQPDQVAEVIAMMTSETGKLLKSQNLVVRV